ncbi:MAG TPA: DUF2066 domain-containing protein [Steroidobacteraceae bacterium]|nr:DUF2066 domain-containing protein [Steroidobacteraceae bacterium]
MLLYLPLRAVARAVQTMSRVRSNSTAAQLRGLLMLLCLMCCALPCQAGRPVHVYEVDIEGQSPTALQGAMREALVRATGRRESADDPALASLITDAPRYVKTYATGPRGESQVVFDASAVEQAIGAAGRSVWPRERPFTLVVLDPPRPRAAQDAARVELERVAAVRGLPISLIPIAIVDAAGNPLGADALLQAAQRYGADEILIGRGEDAGPNTQLQWILYTHALSASWNGSLAEGIDHTVDLLVPRPAASLAQADGEARVEIDGVNSLTAYAAVERLLQSVPGVRRASIAAVDSGSVTFDVTARGGAAGLQQELSATPHLVRTGGGGTQVVYRYQPQG